MKQKRHAEIAGGGFTGLTLATALAGHGWSVRVHERAPQVRDFGAGIWLWENGVRVLNAIGAADEALSGCTEVPDWRSWDRHGRLIDQIAFGPPYSRVFCMPREQLLQAMLAAAVRAGAEVVTGSEAVAAEPGGKLVTADGTSWPADLVAAADGVRSKVRDSLDLLASRHSHIDGAIRLLVPHVASEYDAVESVRIKEWWGGSRRVLYTPCNREIFYICLTMLARDREATAVPVRKDVWKRSFPHLESIIDRFSEEGRYDRFETTKLKRWSKGRVVVLGDAAHSMSPGLGQGCGTSIVNALTLANMLEDDTDITRVFERWEASQRPLAEHTQRWSKITWPLIPWPAWCARAYYNLPAGAAWISRQRRRPSEHIVYGTEKLAQWMPPKLGTAKGEALTE
jgi:2-polyprenyl-6-methoxyphenol hydroxylase-like FAD-dependent oxidoreductase